MTPIHQPKKFGQLKMFLESVLLGCHECRPAWTPQKTPTRKWVKKQEECEYVKINSIS